MADSYYMGLELNEKTAQLCVYNKTTNDADAVIVRVDLGMAESPAHMAFSRENGKWKFGTEADYFASEKGYTLFDDMLDRCLSGNDFEADGELFPCSVVLGELIKSIVSYAGVKDMDADIQELVITVPEVTKTLAAVAHDAFSYVGLSETKAHIQGFDESFYAYTLCQKNEIFGRDVGLFYFREDGTTEYRRLHIDKRTKPMIITVGDNAYTVLPQDDGRDECFEKFITENITGKDFSGFFLVGNGFDKNKAKKSLALLCARQRKVFYGNNLFAKGACFSAYEKKCPTRLKGTLFLGKDLVRKNISIEKIQVDGIETNHLLIAAGVNWFEAMGGCEIILKDADSIMFGTSRLEDGKRSTCVMPLEGLPKRPAGATRLRIEAHFENAEKCVVTVYDLGFGELYPSSGMSWSDSL